MLKLSPLILLRHGTLFKGKKKCTATKLMQKHNFAVQVQLILQITWSKSYCIFILEVEKQIFIMSQVVIRSL